MIIHKNPVASTATLHMQTKVRKALLRKQWNRNAVPLKGKFILMGQSER